MIGIMGPHLNDTGPSVRAYVGALAALRVNYIFSCKLADGLPYTGRYEIFLRGHGQATYASLWEINMNQSYNYMSLS